MKDDFSDADKADFRRAHELCEEGDVVAAIGVAEGLMTRLPHQAAVAGLLAYLHDQAGDLAKCAEFARRATELAPRSELASLQLLHALVELRDLDAAFREAARFRSSKVSVEYDRLLGEWENETLRSLEKSPLDAFRRTLLEGVREELRQRPIRQ